MWSKKDKVEADSGAGLFAGLALAGRVRPLTTDLHL